MSRRVALFPAPVGVSSTPLTSAMTQGVQTFKDKVDDLERRYGVDDLGRTKRGKCKVKKKKKTSKNARVRLTKTEERLITQAANLQQKAKKKFDIANFVKKPRGKRVKGSLKRGSNSKANSVALDRRTTLLSLVRRIPDAKKPLVQWLK